MKWTYHNIPDQTGTVAIVTGANAGIGYETARQLALKGAHVVMASRNEERGLEAIEKILAENPRASVELGVLDLSSLISIRRFVKSFTGKHDRLDLLVNNAGVMVPPMSVTDEGFELQIGVNYLGHFALTGLLFPLIDETSGSRIVTVSSLAHRGGIIDLDNFRGEKHYSPWKAYEQSKLANLIFAIDLQRRLDAAGSRTKSLAAHPGWTKTDLQRHSGVTSLVTSLVGMEANQGALPTLRAATDFEASGGAYYGPNRFGETIGHPERAKVGNRAKDTEMARKLWAVAEEATGVRFLSSKSNVLRTAPRRAKAA